MNRNDTINHYVAEAERIYTNRTAGDNTWLGFLMSFLMDLENASDDDV